MKIFNKSFLLYLYWMIFISFLIFSNISLKAQTPGGTSLNVELWLSADKIQGSTLPANKAEVSSWNDRSSNARNFTKNKSVTQNYNSLPRFSYAGMNYHPAVEFYTSSSDVAAVNNSRKLISETNFPVSSGDGKAYYTFWVSKLASGSSGYSTVLSFNQGRGDNQGWSGTNQIWHETRNINYVHQGIGKNYGLGIDFRQNGAAAATRTQAQYHDGIVRSTAIAASYLYSTGAFPAVIGNSDLGYAEPFFGTVQEIIVLSATGNPAIDLTELNKVQSYLAIKYGLTIGSTFNYVDSNGNIVWNKTVDSAYNNAIVGIGRDDVTGLYQKQAVSADDNRLIMFLGDKLADLNSNNTSDLLNDKDFLLLGSNLSKQYIAYKYQPGAVFQGGDLPGNALDKEINQRYGLTYRAQTGAGRTNFKDVKIITEGMYVLVSANADFAPATTRIYAVDADSGIASIEINNGEYLSAATFEGVPGGLKSNLELWLSADFLLGKSADLPSDDQEITLWKDLSGQGRDFAKLATATAPKVSYSGMNYNPGVNFYQDLSGSTGDDTPATTADDQRRKLVSQDNFTVDANKSYYTFWVSEVDTDITGGSGNGTNRRGVVFTLNGNNLYYNNNGWNIDRVANQPIVSSLETSNGTTTFTKHPKTGITAGIGTMIRPNDTSTSQEQYLNGEKNVVAASTMSTGSFPAVIGSSRAGTYYSESFFGNVQEIVVYTGTKGATMPQDDLQKIHTYLAIKYGISLDGQDYVTSKGIKVWNATDSKNDGYNKHIFGLGRDKPSALYVKQSTSSSASIFTAFVGDELATLNVDNLGTIKDDTYIMFGSNGKTGLADYRYKVEDNVPFINGTLDENVNFRDENVWKVQLTNVTEFTLNINAPGKYILVSDNDPTFAPANTSFYKIDKETGNVNLTLKDGQYITFAYFAQGPGGVVDGLRMWLDAGDKDFIKLNSNGEVLSWKDKSQMSNTEYSFQAVNAANKIPGYDTASFHTNFYPAVNYRQLGEYLSTNKGPASVSSPNGYTVFHIIYNDFIKADRSYFMSFGSKISNANARRPVFGMRGYADGVRGRLWETGGAGSVETRSYLFNPGATSINIQTVDRLTKKITFESNGLSETLTNNSIGGGSRMSGIGVLGGGSAPSWQMQGVMAQSIFYEKLLTAEEKSKIYSYLAFKYAVTLRMPTAWNYTFSDGTSLWNGNEAPYSTYHNNVAALIKDETSDLYNNVARSTGENSVMTMMLRNHKEGTTGQGQESLFEEDLSALIWGDNGKNEMYNFSEAEKELICATADSKTSKIWMVKKTNNLSKVDVTMRILQGDFGGYVSPGYQVILLVADSPDKLLNNNWDMAIPFSYLKDVEQQSLDFSFSSELTYFSLGVKALPGACEACDFEGTKKLTFTTKTWTPSGIKEALFNLGDSGAGDNSNFTVNVKTDVNAAITWLYRYPRNSVYNSLRFYRRLDAKSEQITEITPSAAAATKFQIYNLDREGYIYKHVEIYGLCESGVVMPKLSEVSKRSSYTISGNTAQAKKYPLSGYASNYGRLNVVFDYPVEKIIIKQKGVGRDKGYQNLGISPLEFYCPAPIPPYSEAGLAFSKQATDTLVYCGSASTVDYTFRIYNANCDKKLVSISDTLPADMYWDEELINIPEAIQGDNFSITISEDKRILNLENVSIPGVADPYVLPISAKFIDDDRIVGNTYENQAWLRTSIIKNDVPVEVDPQPSADYIRGEGFKSKTYVKDGGARLSPVTIKIQKSKDCYGASDEILVTLKINNPNSNDVTNMLFDLNYNEEFEYVDKSLSSSISGIGNNPTFETEDGTNISGVFYIDGFTLPGNTESTFSFKLKAPKKDNLIGEIDADGNALDWDGNILPSPFNPDDQAKAELVVGYAFGTDMDDFCIASSLINANGEVEIPFCRSKECIITNRTLQPRIR